MQDRIHLDRPAQDVISLQVAGGDWPALAAEAFAKLSLNPPTKYNGKLLLADIRRVFAEAGVERIFSADLANALCSLADRPYCYPHNLKPKGIVVTPAWGIG